MMFESVMQTFRKFADYSGRASRHEFWMFFAFLLIVNAAARFISMMTGMGLGLSGLVGLLLIVPQFGVAVRRLHDVGHSGKELIVPCAMLAFLPVLFAFQGILPRIIGLGVLGITLLAFANILTLFLKKGGTVPNRYGPSPAAFSYAR
ncbi:MAG: DUF805 domain-containing protein [Sphingomicrobium sp.]